MEHWFESLFEKRKHDYVQVQLPTREEILEIEKNTGLNLLGIESALVQSFTQVVREKLNEIAETPTSVPEPES